MSNIEIIDSSEDAISMMIQRYPLPETGMYETLKSTSAIMYDPYAYVIEYSSY